MPERPLRREPVFNVPATVIGLLLTFGAVQVWRGLLSGEADADQIAWLAFVPARFTALIDPAGVAARVTSWAASSDPDLLQRAALARFFLGDGTTPVHTLLTYAFLHGDWAHLGLNGLWLLAFGTPVARRFGPARFLAFMGVAAVAGALTHWLCFPFGVEPVIGASASVSGCMGAALRFAFRPAIRTEDGTGAQPLAAPPLSLWGVVRDRRALSFLIVWFASNALFGIGSVAFGLSNAPVAWQAHVGGFLAGLLLFASFDPRRKPTETAAETSDPLV